MKQILAIVARNRAGVLMKIIGLIARRGYNIESLTSGSAQKAGYARLTIIVDTDEQAIHQISCQVAKISEVERIKILHEETCATRGMLLVKVRVDDKQMEILQLAQAFRSHAIDVTGNSMTFVNTGSEAKLNAFVNVLRRYGVVEMVQTGIVAMERGDEALEIGESRYEWPDAEAEEGAE